MSKTIDVDPTEIVRSPSKIGDLGSGLAPIGASTATGVAAYGFPVLAAAVRRFVESIDDELEESSGRLARQASNLRQTVRDFESFDRDAQDSIAGLMKGLLR